MKRTAVLLVMLVSLLIGSAFAQTENVQHETGVERDANVPNLPFDDNPDPLLCGIPQPYGSNNQAWLTGYYEGELIQEDVLLYDSHLRRSVVGSALTGSEIEIVLYQVNPTLNYYYVRTVGNDDPQTGWIPAPFVSFDAPF